MISVIVPVFNVEPYLAECFDSVRYQTFRNWECICIDDGSTDRSGEICDQYAEKDPRFHVFHKENGGVSDARNVGLRHALGDWLLFIDADDLLHPEALSVLMACVENVPETDVIYFDYVFEKNIHFPEEKIFEVEVVHQNDHLPELNLWRCFFHRDILLDSKFKNYIVGEDILFTTEILLKSKQIFHLPLCIYGYRDRPGSTMHRHSFRRSCDDIFWMVDIFKLYFKKPEKFAFSIRKRRWHQFFFKMADEIFSFSGSEREKLIRIWFDALEQISEIRIYLVLDRLRKIYLLLGKGSFLFQTLLLRINQLIFRCYTMRTP